MPETTVTLYKVRNKGLNSTAYRFEPPSGSELEFDDDGGRDYILPAGWQMTTSESGFPMLLEDGCEVGQEPYVLEQGPALIDKNYSTIILKAVLKAVD